MASQVYLTEAARGDLQRIDRDVSRRIIDKLIWYSERDNPIHFARHLTNSLLGTYRFRVGDYCIIFDLSRNNTVIILVVLRIRHRREVYE